MRIYCGKGSERGIPENTRHYAHGSEAGVRGTKALMHPSPRGEWMILDVCGGGGSSAGAIHSRTLDNRGLCIQKNPDTFKRTHVGSAGQRSSLCVQEHFVTRTDWLHHKRNQRTRFLLLEKPRVGPEGEISGVKCQSGSVPGPQGPLRITWEGRDGGGNSCTQGTSRAVSAGLALCCWVTQVTPGFGELRGRPSHQQQLRCRGQR